MAPFCSAFGLLDIGAAINTAVDELSRTRNWDRLRRLVRLTVTGENFSLPQDCGPIIRACINYSPVSVRGTEIEFLSSGPGDYDAYADSGWAPLHGIQRVGVYPTAHDPTESARLAAYATTVPEGVLRVRGRDENDDRVVEDVPISVWDGYSDAAAIDPDTADRTTAKFKYIDSVSVPVTGSAYISLYAVETEVSYLARFHPKVAIPEFVRYRIPGFSGEDDASVSLLAEVAARVLPMADDDEVLPFDSLLPVQYMLQAMKAMDTGEVETADKFRARAASALAGREENELERQTPLVINSNLELSPGSVSDLYANI